MNSLISSRKADPISRLVSESKCPPGDESSRPPHVVGALGPSVNRDVNRNVLIDGDAPMEMAANRRGMGFALMLVYEARPFNPNLLRPRHAVTLQRSWF